MKNNKILLRSYVFALCSLLIALMSCEDILDTNSTRNVTVDENKLASPNDSVQSVLGILRLVQNVADRYVLLGEMRADLLDVTDFTEASIRELSNYTISDTNKYINPRDYYAIINNCNYFISRTGSADNPLKNENALVHAIRAWTYMQVVFNWGKAYYFTEPLLSVSDTKKKFPEYTVAQVVDALIADLEPLANASYPNYGNVYNFTSSQMFFPIKVLLGDLYLWRGSSVSDYEKAATYYAEVIDSRTVVTNNTYSAPSIRWNYDNFIEQDFETAVPINTWSDITLARTSSSELVTAIQMATSASEGKISYMPGNYLQFKVSDAINTLWDNQSYVMHYEPTDKDYYTTGDLRKRGNIERTSIIIKTDGSSVKVPVLYKIYQADHRLVYRMGLIWLHYAEAVNRAGKPHTAFAILKYGLNSNTFLNNIPAEEWTNTSYINIFNASKYDNIEGIHARGCGNSAYDINFIIGETTDTIARVEELICAELAMETSFEGNRMQDLMRMALRRNDPAFLAARIAAKSKNDYGRIYNLLSSDTKNWFLPDPKQQ
jgi:hypothetical protein